MSTQKGLFMNEDIARQLADLQKAYESGALSEERYKTLAAALQAKIQALSSTAAVPGSGAVAQGSGDALGAGAVKVTGDVQGPIITGSGNVLQLGGSAADAALPPTLAPLRDKLITHFNKSELEMLCFDLGIAADDLPGQTRGELAQSLVAYCRQRGRLPDLIHRCQAERPHVAWE